MDAIHPKPAAHTGPARQQIDRWEMEWAAAPRGHWGDRIDWGTARIIADRLDGKSTDPFAPDEKSAISPVPQQSRRTDMDDIDPAPLQFTADELATDPILYFFHYTHLPAALQETSWPFCSLAVHIVGSVPRNAERTVALRKLLEAKDAAVRANVGGGALASKTSFLDRLKTEQSELSERLRKLSEFLGSGGPSPLPVSQGELLWQQRSAMSEYLAILTARIENIEHETGQTTTAPLGEAREIGDADQDRDGPIKFEG